MSAAADGERPVAKIARAALVALAVAAVLVHCWCFRAFCVDDAAISFTYARNLAHSHGLVLFPGGERVEAYSNFLWVVLLAAGIRLGADVFLLAKLLGAALAGATVVGVAELLAALRGRRAALDGGAALLAAALTPIAYWSMSGLEGPLYLALLVWCAVRLVRERDRPELRPLSALLTAALALTRPDGWLVAAAAAVARLAGDRRPRALATWYALALGPVGAHVLWRYAYYAYPFPNTFYVKVTRPFRLRELFDRHAAGWTYVLDNLDRYRLTLAALPALAAFARVRRLVPRLTVLALLLAALFFPLYARGDWMGEGRFVAPILPLLVVLVVDGLGRVAALVARWRLDGAAASVLVAALAAWLVPNALRHTRERIGHYPIPVSHVAIRAHTYARVAAALGLAHPSALDGDLGGTSFFAGMPIVDLGALGDVTLARHGANHAAQRAYLFGERRPTFMRIVSFWKEAGIEDYPEFKARYVRLRVPGPGNEGLSIARAAFTVDGIDTRRPLARFAAEGVALVGARVDGKTVELWLLVERTPAAALTLRASAGAAPVTIGDGYYAPADWRPGEVLHTRVARPAGANLSICGQTCVPLADGDAGARPVALPAPSPAARARLVAAHAWTVLARIDAERGNPAVADALYRRGQAERAAGDAAHAFRDFLLSVRLDPRRSFARRQAEELRLRVPDAYDWRAQLALDGATRDFHLHPDGAHLGALAVAAKAADAPRAAVLAQLATGLVPDDAAGRAALTGDFAALGLDAPAP